MKVSVLLLLAFVMMVVLSSVEGWRLRRAIRRIRIRIRLRRVCKAVCKTTCVVKCPGCTPVCSPVCNKICGRKRALTQEPEVRSVPMPCNFSKYDTDNDGFISREEFEQQIGDPFEEGLFEAIDADDDGKISKKEFKDACEAGNSGTKRYVKDEGSDNIESADDNSETKRDVEDEGTFSNKIDALEEEE